MKKKFIVNNFQDFYTRHGILNELAIKNVLTVNRYLKFYFKNNKVIEHTFVLNYFFFLVFFYAFFKYSKVYLIKLFKSNITVSKNCIHHSIFCPFTIDKIT